MKAEKFIFISGRTLKQGRTLHLGKHSPEYGEEVSSLEMNELDMAGLDLNEGDEVQVKTEAGRITARCRLSDNLPRGIVFMPYGLPANMLIGVDTGGTGMPDFKGIDVEICR
ncbi:hypothetical protein ES703_18035 [subsurface metagenome]